MIGRASERARISHHLTAKARDRCATTSLRSIVVLDGLSSTPPRANRRPPRIDVPLTHFRSPRGGKCGLVNVAKLGDTFVDASSVNAGRELDNVFYGVLNLFDGGDNIVNNINYTYWLTDSATRHWVKLRFRAAVEVHSILVEFNAAQAFPAERPRPSRRPEGFALDVVRLIGGSEQIEKLPSVNVDGFRVIYPLDAVLSDVTELMFVFPGPSMTEVAEIEVMGVPSGGHSQIGQGPRIRNR